MAWRHYSSTQERGGGGWYKTMDTEGLGKNRFVLKPLAWGGGGGAGKKSTFPLSLKSTAERGCHQACPTEQSWMPTTRFTKQHTQSRLTTLQGTERKRGERGGLWGRGEERLHPVALPPRQGPRQRFTRPRGARQLGRGDPGSPVEQHRPPGASGRPRPRFSSRFSPRPGAVLVARRHRRPGPGRCQPAGSLSALGCGPRTRASYQGPALPETAPRKAAAAAPPRAPAPRASPRPRRLAPVRTRGASPYRQPARPPDGQEGRQEEPANRHPPASAAPSYRQEPRLRHPPRSPSFLLLLGGDSAQPPPPARPSPTRPAPPARPLYTLSLLPPRPTPPVQARQSLGKKNRRSQGNRRCPIRVRHCRQRRYPIRVRYGRLLPSLRPFPFLRSSTRSLPPTGRRWLAGPQREPPAGQRDNSQSEVTVDAKAAITDNGIGSFRACRLLCDVVFASPNLIVALGNS